MATYLGFVSLFGLDEDDYGHAHTHTDTYVYIVCQKLHFFDLFCRGTPREIPYVPEACLLHNSYSGKSLRHLFFGFSVMKEVRAFLGVPASD